MGRVVAVGSYNVSLTVVAPALPAPGQTVLGHTFDMGPGGKG
jgi:ribokinase